VKNTTTTQITRQHRARRRRSPALVVGVAAAALGVSGAGIAVAAGPGGFGDGHVGQDTAEGVLLASNQVVKPIGKRVLVNDGKLLASTPSPDGRHLAAATAGRGIALTMFDAGGKIIQQVGTAATADLKIDSNNVGQEGPTWSPDGKFLWLAQVNGFQRFPVKSDGTLAAPTFIALAADGPRAAVPAGAAFSPDGSKLYAALNGQNALGVLDAATGKLLASYPTGIAPRQVQLIGNTAYVTNEGGRAGTPYDFTLNSYHSEVVSDPSTGSATTGTVSVVDVTKDPASVKTGSIPVGLHPTAFYRHGDVLFVTNTVSDSVSVIDTTKNQVVQTFNTRPWPQSSVGYHPNAITMPDDSHVVVSLGRANALAVYGYTTPQAPVTFQGLLPTDYYPVDVVTSPALGGKLVVTNERGIGSLGAPSAIDKGPGTQPGAQRVTDHNTHNVTGSLTVFSMPAAKDMARYTRQVFAQNKWTPGVAKAAAASRTVAPAAVPARIGDPSPIKHVFLIVKENRTYDQVLGDLPKGNGDPSLAQFGAPVTPNQHALSTQFGTYDNSYDIGTNSAEGHQWLMQADDPGYVESQFGEYERSYGQANDALGHQRDGFLWNAAAAAGQSTRVFGEYEGSFSAPPNTSWADYFRDSKHMQATGAATSIHTDTSSPIPSLNAITDHAFPLFNLNVPDQYRADIWKKNFAKNGPANLNLMWVLDDHTSGVGGNTPYPVAQAADNDLAVGRIVDTISHSPYWKSSAIFVIEDDSQNGVDHVDGHRGPLQIISPYAIHGKVDSTYSTQLNVVRTIEQILGMSPMNQKDRAATPMTQAFTNTPDLTPYTVRANQVPLTYGLPLQAPATGTGPGLSVADGQVFSGTAAVYAGAGKDRDVKLSIDGRALPTRATAQGPGFVQFESTGLQAAPGALLDTVTVNGRVIPLEHNFGAGETVTVPVPAGVLKAGGNTVTVRSGTTASATGTDGNNDNFTVTNLRVHLLDGTDVHDPAVPNEEVRKIDDAHLTATSSFTLAAGQLPAVGYTADTTRIADGEHQLTATGTTAAGKREQTTVTVGVYNPAGAAPKPVPAAKKAIYQQWTNWSAQQHFTGSTAIADYANPEQLNRLTWYQMHNWTTPYPGDNAVYGPDQVPGALYPTGDTEG